MSTDFSGFDKLSQKLKEIQRNAENLSNNGQVSFKDLFTESFMLKHTGMQSMSKFLKTGGFHVESTKDFEEIPDDVFDKHVQKFSDFNSWKAMLDKAVEEYTIKKLGF